MRAASFDPRCCVGVRRPLLQYPGSDRGLGAIPVGAALAGTGLAHHNERRRARHEALSAGGPVEMGVDEVEEAIKQALNTTGDD